jgi:BNR repeat-like domain
MKRLLSTILALSGLSISAQPARADWTLAKRLTWNEHASYRPAIAIDSTGDLHLVWNDYIPGNGEIYYMRSRDGGNSWSANRRVTWTSGGSTEPDMAIDSSDNLHLVWCDTTPGNQEIFYKRSTDEGATWLSTQRLTWTLSESAPADIAVGSSGSLHVVWYDFIPGNFEVFYKKSTDGGATWSSSHRITSTSGSSCNAAIAVDSSGNPHVVWADDTSGDYEIYYKKSPDGGATWTASQRLTWNSGWSTNPAIAVDSSDRLHVVWHDDSSGNLEIYYRRSMNGGETWATRQRLSWNSGKSYYPVIVVDSSDNLHVTWHDNTPANYEIYYKMSSDAGINWSTAQRLTVTSGFSYHPTIAVDSSGKVHIVWEDDTPGNLEMYYKSGN